MRVSHTKLSPATLRAVVQRFVTRDGMDHSPLERRIENGLRQFEAGRVELHFDDQTETYNIVPVEAGRNPLVYDFGSMGVEDVRHVKEQGIEMLQIIIDERDSMTLKIKPRIEIEQRVHMDE